MATLDPSARTTAKMKDRLGRPIGDVELPIYAAVRIRLEGAGYELAKEHQIQTGDNGCMVVSPIQAVAVFAGCGFWSRSPHGLIYDVGMTTREERLRGWLAERRKNADALARRCGALVPSAAYRPSPRAGPQLYAHQHAAVEWLELARGRAILGDDMGVGKTAAVLAYLARSDARRILIVTPKTVVSNWVKEAQTWAPSIQTAQASSGKRIRHRFEDLRACKERFALITTWDAIPRSFHRLALLEFDTVIADEAHFGKTPLAARTVALRDLAYGAERCVLMTGTQVRNRPAEGWSLRNMVDPVEWPSFIPYGERYCQPRNVRRGTSGATVRVYRGVTKKRLTELFTRSQPYVMRREKGEALPDLPRLTRRTVEVDAGEAARRAFDQWKQAIESGDSVAALTSIAPLRLATGLGKVAKAVEVALGQIERGHRVVMFVHHRDVHLSLLKSLLSRGLRVASIVGHTSEQQRKSVAAEFQAGDLDVLIGSSAMATGATLTRGTRVVFVEYWWTPADTEQGICRVYRNSQTQPTVVTFVKALGPSIDNAVLRLWDSKLEVTQALSGKHLVDFELRRALR